VYGDRNGNVYRQNQGGGWDKNTAGGWQQAGGGDRASAQSSQSSRNTPPAGLSRDAAARGYPGSGGYRGGGRGGRR
jgi:hypothetical protein